MCCLVAVVFCPPVPDYMSGTVFKTPYYNNFSAEVTYWCDSNYVFSAYANDTDPKASDIKLTSKCLETKEWSPPFQTCQRKTASHDLESCIVMGFSP